MNKRALLALFTAAAAVPALAQYGGRRRGGGMGGDQGRPAEKDAGGEPRVNTLEITAHELEEDLKLTPEQQPLWQSYLDKVRALGNDVARERSRRPVAPVNVAQQIDRILDAARNRLTALEDIAQAAKTLYAKLTPEQQPAADPRLANLMAMPLQQAPEGGPRGRAPR